MTETAVKKVIPGIAVIGSSAAAEVLSGDDLTFISFDHNRLERISGAVGAFELLLRGAEGLLTVKAGAIVLLPAAARGASEGQVFFDRLCGADPRAYARQRVAIVLDRVWPADAELWQPLLAAASRITEAGGMIDIISRQTAVDFKGGQAAYTAARSGGVRFIRYSGDLHLTETSIRLNHAIVTSPVLAGEVTLDYDLIIEPARQSAPAETARTSPRKSGRRRPKRTRDFPPTATRTATTP